MKKGIAAIVALVLIQITFSGCYSYRHRITDRRKHFHRACYYDVFNRRNRMQ